MTKGNTYIGRKNWGVGANDLPKCRVKAPKLKKKLGNLEPSSRLPSGTKHYRHHKFMKKVT